MRLVLSRFALVELDEILAYLSQRSPLGAGPVEARMRRAFEHIARHPDAAERSINGPTCVGCRSGDILTSSTMRSARTW